MTSSPIKLGAFSIAGCAPFIGLVIDDARVLAVDALRSTCEALDLRLGRAATLQDLLDDWERNIASICAALPTADLSLAVGLEHLRRHAPLPAPRQILCLGANYRKHVIDLMTAQGGGGLTDGQSLEERRATATRIMDERAASGVPYAWVKASSTVAGPDDVLILPAHVTQPDWELELAVIIGKPAFRVSRSEALRYIAGFTIVNDLTARDWVFRTDDMKVLGTDWLVGKCAPGFLPMGPYVMAAQAGQDIGEFQITLRLNGEIMQDESASDMIFDVARQIEYISAHSRLMPGDIICTGSPAGNGAHYNRFLRDGDLMEGSISGLGTQTVRCRSALPGETGEHEPATAHAAP